MGKYEALAKEIVKQVGGKENVNYNGSDTSYQRNVLSTR